jgi:hypothetical protein
MNNLPNPAECWMPQLDCGWRADIQPIMAKSGTGVWVHYSDYSAMRKAAEDAITDGDRRVAEAHKLAETYLDLWRKLAETEKPAHGMTGAG